jgi:hypothetical protein
MATQKDPTDYSPQTLVTDRQPWEQQPAEPDKWYARFELYKDAGGERTMVGTWRRVTGREQARQLAGNWTRHATRWRWRERARKWDRHLRDLAREEHEQAVIEMGRRAARHSVALQGVLMLPAQAVARLLQTDRDALLASLMALPPDELIRLTQRSANAIGQAVRTEMLARGEATDRIEQHAALQVDIPDAAVRDTLGSLLGNAKAHDLARQLALLSLEGISTHRGNGTGNGNGSGDGNGAG